MIPKVYKIKKKRNAIPHKKVVVKAKKVAKKDQKAINLTPKEWEAFRARWTALKAEHGRKRYNEASMLEETEGWYLKSLKDPKELIGQPVILALNEDGYFYSQYAYPGIIIQARVEEGKLITMILRKKIKEEPAGEDQIWTSQAWRILPYAKVELSAEELKLKQEIKMKQILYNLNQRITADYQSIKANKGNLESYVKSYTASLAGYQKRLKETNEILKGNKPEELTADTFRSSLDSLLKHKKVKGIAVTLSGNLIIESKMLYVIDHKTDKETDVEVGEFAFFVDTRYGEVSVHNMSYVCNYQTDYGNDHGSPFQDGTRMCWGPGETDVKNLAKQFPYYALVDYITLFVAMIKQDAGAIPHCSPDMWLKHRKKESTPNPFNGEFAYVTEGFSPKKAEPQKPIVQRVIEKVAEIKPMDNGEFVGIKAGWNPVFPRPVQGYGIANPGIIVNELRKVDDDEIPL